MRVLGVDVSLGRGLDVALLEGSVVKDTWSRVGPDGLRRLLDEQSPDAVAIDSPPAPVAARDRLAPDPLRREPAVLVDDGGVRDVPSGR